MGGRHETRRDGLINELPEAATRTTDRFGFADSRRAGSTDFGRRDRPPGSPPDRTDPAPGEPPGSDLSDGDPTVPEPGGGFNGKGSAPNSARPIRTPPTRKRAGRGKDLSLTPNLRERIGALLPGPPRPRGTRALLARRIAAAALFVLAGVLAVLPTGPPGDQVRVVVAAHDLAPGLPLGDDDLGHRSLPADLVPDGALRDPAAAVGRALAGAARGGEPLTDVRLADAEPAGSGPAGVSPDSGQVAVPVRLADPAVADLLRPGARVDLVTNPEHSATGAVLAERVPVLAVRTVGDGPDQGRLVLVGIPEQRAPAVAGASLIHSVTVTLR